MSKQTKKKKKNPLKRHEFVIFTTDSLIVTKV